MFHPYALLYGYVDEPTDSNRAPPTCLWSKQFYETDLSRGFVRGYAFQFGRGVGPVVEAVMSEAKGILPWGTEHHSVFRRLNGHRLSLAAICEDLPEERNRVTLDPVLKDSRGIPAPRVDYTIGENSAKMLEHGVARPRRFSRPPAPPTSASIAPSCMAAGICSGRHAWHGPKRSVVNEWGRSHDVKICSSSTAACLSRQAASIRHPPFRPSRSTSPIR